MPRVSSDESRGLNPPPILRQDRYFIHPVPGKIPISRNLLGRHALGRGDFYNRDMMQHGFLGFDASFMLDFVVTALVAIVPVLLYSLYVVKVQKNYLLHRNLQVFLGATLLIAVLAFEVDTQLIHGGWRNIVNKNSDAPRLDGEKLAEVTRVLRIHLIFAISTPFLWVTTLALAWRRFPNPPHPAPHSRLHKSLGWLSVLDIVATSLTGLWFYYAAFVA